MIIIKLVRNLKNNLLRHNKNVLFFVKVVNLFIFGDIYDYFYIRFIRNKINKHPYELTIEPNNICNLKCIMCPYKRMKRKKETMSMDLFKKIVDEAKEIGCKHIHLTQYNEPFTDKLIFERIKHIRQKRMESSFYSNAMLLDDEKIKNILKNPPDLIRFSVDGVKKETFESIRVNANFERVTNNIKKLYKERNLKKQKFPVIEVFFTVLEKNKKECKQFLKSWKDNCDFASLYPADSRESRDFVGLDYKKLKPYPCFNPKRVLVLSNCKVALCCVDIDGDIILGDLKKQNLKELLNSSAYKKIYESQMNRTCDIKMCKNCSKFYIDSAFQWWLY